MIHEKFYPMQLWVWHLKCHFQHSKVKALSEMQIQEFLWKYEIRRQTITEIRIPHALPEIIFM